MATTFTPKAIFRAPQSVIQYPAAGTEKSGDVKIFDQFVGVFMGISTPGADGDAGYRLKGQFEFVAGSSDEYDIDDEIYINTTTFAAATSSGEGKVFLGLCTRPKIAGETVVLVNINYPVPFGQYTTPA